MPVSMPLDYARRAAPEWAQRAWREGANVMMRGNYLTQLLKGNTDVLILSLLEREPMYGHQIMEALEHSSAGFFQVSEGTLYPALYRLAREGLVRGRWSRLPSGQERKFY